MHYRKFSALDRKYPVFVCTAAGVTLCDVSRNDKGVVEIAVHGSVVPRTFDFSFFEAALGESLNPAAGSAAA
jgi:hypothetical protein